MNLINHDNVYNDIMQMYIYHNRELILPIISIKFNKMKIK